MWTTANHASSVILRLAPESEPRPEIQNQKSQTGETASLVAGRGPSRPAL
jgi:hypothetical protein